MTEENGDGSPSALELKIIKQVEYYFGDMNLPRDRFLQDQITEDNGWVTLETMLKFNRLKQLSEEEDVISTALKKSTSGLMEVSEDNKKIRRSPDMPIPDNTKERREEIASRSIYAKGFPLGHTLDQLQEYFAQHGKVENILMRRVPKTKEFKGSVFVVFANKEDAKKFVEAEGLKYEETELIRLFKDDYFKKKTGERKKAAKQGAKPEGEDAKKETQDEDEKLREKITIGTILRLDGLPGEITVEDVKNFFSDFGQVLWVDHNKGETKGYVRFAEENEAAVVVEKAKESGEGKIEINNNEVEAKVLEGEEELNHWKMIFRVKEEKYQKIRKDRNKQGNRRNKQGYRGKRRGHRESGDGEPAAKSVKKDDGNTEGD